MRPVSAIMPVFWTRGTGKSLRGNRDAQLLAVYLMSCPYGSMTGIFCVAIPTIAFELGMTTDEVKAALAVLRGLDFARYDEEECLVYLPGGLATQVGASLGRGDKRAAAIARELSVFVRHPFFSALLLKYGETHREALSKLDAPSMPLASPFDAPSMPLRRGMASSDPNPQPLRSPFEAPSEPLRRGMQLGNPNLQAPKTKTKLNPFLDLNSQTYNPDSPTAPAPAHARDGESDPASASQIRVVVAPAVQDAPGRAETAMPGQEALDPVPAPPTPQGAAAIDIQPRPLPASESRLMGSVWIEAYERAARDTWDYPRWTFEPRQMSTLDRVISTQCETPDRARICDWIHRTVVEFAKAIGDKRQFWAGGQPAGLEKWLNCGKPAEKALSASPVTRADIESAMHPSRRKFKKDGTYAD